MTKTISMKTENIVVSAYENPMQHIELLENKRIGV